MASFPQDQGVSPRRFVVAIEALNLRDASYEAGDVVTQTEIGQRGDYFVAIGAIEEIDYDLSQLYEGPRNRWQP